MKLLNEIDLYDYNMKEMQKRFEQFTKELAKLSMTYDICLRCVGGVDIYDVGSLTKVIYLNDSTSGDLEYDCRTVDN